MMKKIIAFIFCIALLLSSFSFSEEPIIEIENVKNSEEIIEEPYEAENENGIPFDFHIFAEDIELNCHTNGNIAAENLDANNQTFGTNQDTEGETNYIAETAVDIGEITSTSEDIIIVGEDVELEIVDNGNRIIIGESENAQDHDTSDIIYQETEISEPYIDISKELDKLEIISAELAQQEDNAEMIADEESNQYNVDVEDIDTTYYISIDPTEYEEKIEINIVDTKLATIIFNVNMTVAKVFDKVVSTIKGHDNSESNYGTPNNVLYNFYQNINGIIETWKNEEVAEVGTSDYFMGTILAPGAHIKYGAVNGSIIAREAVSNGDESHNWLFTGNLSIPTPTPIPTNTPEPTPTNTPEPTPTPTFEPTVTPTIEPTLTPTIKPINTPTVKPTITPSSSPTNMPEVTSTPTSIPTTLTPTIEPTIRPTSVPTQNPIITNKPSSVPTIQPYFSQIVETGDKSLLPIILFSAASLICLILFIFNKKHID